MDGHLLGQSSWRTTAITPSLRTWRSATRRRPAGRSGSRPAGSRPRPGLPSPSVSRLLPVALAGFLLLLALPVAFALPASTDATPDTSWVATDDDGAVARLAAELGRSPGDLALGNRYRLAARRAGLVDMAIAHLDSLRTEHPAETALTIQLALAQLDRLGRPDVDLATAAITVNRVLRLADAVLRDDPGSWPAHYVRGLSKLLWPSSTRRARDAVVDFELCLHNLAHPPRTLESWPVHLLIGDANVKERRYGLARERYEIVLDAGGPLPVVRERLDLASDDLLEHIETLYSLTRPVLATDLGPFWPSTTPEGR